MCVCNVCRNTWIRDMCNKSQNFGVISFYRNFDLNKITIFHQVLHFKNNKREWAFDPVVKTLVRMPITQIAVPRLNSQCCFLSLASCSCRPNGAVVTAQIAGFLPATWELWIEFSASGWHWMEVHSFSFISQIKQTKRGLLY